ncbi:hypothetical protein LWI28_004805 [Acer negundo]|uniref:Uncharacterized protein n=1 Tax=Acer negundo TaxID=4023 RepID=A0AAD5IP14_ACENE|nr:hypothetical protein LWI28_004805 [Acer negundo]
MYWLEFATVAFQGDGLWTVSVLFLLVGVGGGVGWGVELMHSAGGTSLLAGLADADEGLCPILKLSVYCQKLQLSYNLQLWRLAVTLANKAFAEIDT